MELNRRTAFVYLVLLTAMLTWGLSFLAIKDVVKTVPVFRAAISLYWPDYRC